MFTGLVEEVGQIQTIAKGQRAARITIRADKVLRETRVGDSISTNGVCLTVTDFSKGSFTVDVMAETMRRTNLHLLSPGDEVNLERALKVGDRLGGHLVSGHIDGLGAIKHREQEENAVWLTIEAETELLKYIIPKGSIAIDGVSLTAARAEDVFFKVSIIPHTRDATTLLRKKAGDKVNLECDMVGKYVERLLRPESLLPAKKEISLQFLSEHGFA